MLLRFDPTLPRYGTDCVQQQFLTFEAKLLDTHSFIWWADEPEKLSPAALYALEDEANELLLSVASVWEMQMSAWKSTATYTVIGYLLL